MLADARLRYHIGLRYDARGPTGRGGANRAGVRRPFVLCSGGGACAACVHSSQMTATRVNTRVDTVSPAQCLHSVCARVDTVLLVGTGDWGEA